MIHDQKSRRKSENRLGHFLALAVLIHLAALPVLDRLAPTVDKKPPQNHRIRLVPPPSAVKKRPVHIKKEKADKEKLDEDENLKGQIVDLPPSLDDTPPEDSKYLSEYNTRTEKESRSRNQSRVFLNAQNERTTTAPKKAAETSPADAIDLIGNIAKKGNQNAKAAETHFEVPKQEKQSSLALKLDPDLGKYMNQEMHASLAGEGQEFRLVLGKESPKKDGDTEQSGKPLSSHAQILPELGVVSDLAGAPANDALQDLEEAEGTFLNSRQFKYASFFNRLKRGVSQHWHPMNEYRRRDPSGNVYGFQRRVTVLSVILSRDGSLKEVRIQESSGLPFLDSEAVNAFHRAQPFPNPPGGLRDSDTGLISFPFGFHVDFSRGGMRLPF